MATDEVAAGPFEREPLDLGRLLSDGFSPAVGGDEVVARCERWLTEVLDDAAVGRGAFDAEMVALLAADGWSVTQVIGGWIRRAACGRGDVGRDGDA